jgi:hypothetical protein
MGDHLSLSCIDSKFSFKYSDRTVVASLFYMSIVCSVNIVVFKCAKGMRAAACVWSTAEKEWTGAVEDRRYPSKAGYTESHKQFQESG